MPIDPFFPPRPHPKNPIVGRGHFRDGKGTRYVGIEYRDPECYWITCHMDNTGVEFTTQVARDFVIDPDPQDMISRINQVGMLLGVWSGCLLGVRVKVHCTTQLELRGGSDIGFSSCSVPEYPLLVSEYFGAFR